MKLIVATEEELEKIINKSVNYGISQYFGNKEREGSRPKTCTVPDAGKRLMVSDQTVRSYIKRGLIKAEKIGRRILIDTTSIDKALSEVKSLKYKR